jgi:hypothetical protein
MNLIQHNNIIYYIRLYFTVFLLARSNTRDIPFSNILISKKQFLCDKKSYYIDRCELWGFICEINSGISHVKYQFFPTGTTFTQL